MHLLTETLIAEELLDSGLNPDALPIIRDLLTAIEWGHTALLIKDEQQHLFEKFSDELSALLSFSEGRLQIKRHAEQEKRIAAVLLNRIGQTNINHDPSALMPSADISQQRAITGAINNKFALILGGPGTGKTSTAAAVIIGKILSYNHLKTVALVAPTGKAAARLSASFKFAICQSNTSFQPTDFPEASTIHRQLNRLDRCDIVLVDEASMISLDLMDRLLASIGSRTHLVLMGDPNQLTSIEAGSILATLAISKRLSNHRFTLTEQHRIDGEPFLNELQSTCLAGDTDSFLQLLKSRSGSWIKHGQEKMLTRHIQDGYKRYIDQIVTGHLKDPDFQVLTSTSYGLGGRKWVNQVIIDHFSTVGMLGKGNRYLVTENQSMLGLYNGDVGIQINNQNHEKQMIYFSHLGKAIGKSQITGLELAFAISIHRSQGSEYKNVCISLTRQNRRNLCQPTRELLYTALTRAKVGITLYASQAQIETAIKNSSKRKSCLHLFLDG